MQYKNRLEPSITDYKTAKVISCLVHSIVIDINDAISVEHFKFHLLFCC